MVVYDKWLCWRLLLFGAAGLRFIGSNALILLDAWCRAASMQKTWLCIKVWPQVLWPWALDMRTRDTKFIFQQQDLGHKGIFEKNGFQFFFSRRPSEFPGKIDFFIFYYPKQTVNAREWSGMYMKQLQVMCFSDQLSCCWKKIKVNRC